MTLAGKFTDVLPDGQGAHLGGHLHVDTVSTHAPPGAIIVRDAHLLFTGDFKRAGLDLVLSGDGRELVLHDYFKGEKRAALASTDGAHLTGDIVNALTGHTQLAQADGSPSVAQVIGHVTKLVGTATAIRNGVSIILNQGDNVNKGDVVQSGSDSSLGITFIDGSVFGLASNAKMVLNEMVYDPNGSNNSSLISLVQGTISFVAGGTAKKGDMKVDTPVATMGIRGTAVLVEIDFVVPGQGGAPPAKFQVLVEPDGTTGSYILFDKTTLTPIATVNQAGTQTIVNGQGTVNFLSSVQLSPDAQKIISDVFQLKFTDLNNPQSLQRFGSAPTLESLFFKTASGDNVAVTVKTVQVADIAAPSTGGTATKGQDHISGPPDVVTTNAAFTERAGLTGSTTSDKVTGEIRFADLNAADQPTAQATFDSFKYQNAQHADVTGSLTARQIAAIQAVEVPLVVLQDPNNKNTGTATWTYSLPDGAFDFLAAGETLTLTYMARVDNNYAANNEITFKPITITITGTNDGPVFTTGPRHVAFVGGKNTPGGPLTTSDPTSGTLSFADPDLTDTHTVSNKLTSATLAGADISQLAPGPRKIFETALSTSIATGNDSTLQGVGTINWKLADLAAYLADFIPAGQTLTLVYTVTVTDSQNATSSQNLTVTITGNDTPAVVWIATTNPGSPSEELWSDTANWGTGTVPTATDDAIIITDQLRGLTPSYPVTITSAATAKSLTMNDYGTLFTNSPTLINNSTLTIGAGGIGLGADSIIRNNGTISVGGLMEVLNQSSLQNSGSIYLAHGGDFRDQSVITNSGAIEVAGGTLNIQADVANTGGSLVVDGGARMTLGAATITGGSVTNAGELDLTGAAVLKDGSLRASGQINVGGNGNAWHNESVTVNNVLSIAAGGRLTIDQGSTVTNTGIIGLTFSATSMGVLTLNDATIDGGSVLNSGAINLTGGGVLKNGTLSNFNYVQVSGLGNAFHHETVNVGGALVILAGGALTIDQGSTIANPYSLEIYGGGSLTLNHATIDTGVVYNDPGGTVGLTGSAVVKNGSFYNIGQTNVSGTGNALHNENVTNIGALEVLAGGALLLDQVTFANASGSITVDGTATLTLNAAIITGGTVNDGGTIHVTGNSAINGTALNNGQLTVDATKTLTLDGTTVTGAIIANTGATLSVSATKTVTLDDVTVNGGSITDNGTVHVDASRTLTLNGVTVTGGALTNDGTIDTTATTVLNGVGITNAGTIEATNGVLKITGSVLGTGSIQVDAGAFLELDATVAATQTIVFDGAGSSEVQIDAATFGGQIRGMAATDEIDLRTIGYSLSTTGTYVGDANGGVLTITDGTHSISMTLVGDYLHAHFAGASDGHGGTLITLNAADSGPSFAAGETAQTGAFAELSDTTGSSTSNPVPALTGSVHFTDIDLVDRPTATITSQTVTWTDHTTDLSASLSQAQIDTLGHALLLQQSGNTNNGVIGWTYAISDSALDFLAAGQTVTVTSTITLDDHEGRTDTASVAITITGANDAPALAPDVSGDAGTALHTITERTDVTGSTSPDTAAGSLAFRDVDLSDTHTVGSSDPAFGWLDANGQPVSLTLSQVGVLTAASALTLTLHDSTGSGLGSVDFSYSAADNAFDFLAAGEKLTITYDITVTDEHHVASTQPVTITIIGANDTATIGGKLTGDVVEDASTTVNGSSIVMFDSGVATVDDVDHGEGHFQAVDSASLNGTYGIFTFDSNSGAWTYQADPSKVQSLGQNDHVTDKLTVTSFDGTAHADIVVTITGTNDAPQYAGQDLASTYHAGDAPTAIVHSGVTVSDIDSVNYAGGTLTATVTAGGQAGDTLTLANTQYVMVDSGTIVMFDTNGDAPGGWVQVGTLSHDGDNSLTVTLNGNADDAAVAALTEAVQFSNATENPIAGTRTVGFTLHDGGGTDHGGHDSAYFETHVTVAAASEGVAAGPVIQTDQFTVSELGNGVTKVAGLYVTDADANAAETFTFTATTGASPESSVAPSIDPGHLSDVNAALEAGVVYDPGGNPQPPTDSVKFTVTDGSGHSDTVNFIFNNQNGDGDVTLTGTTGKDVLFGTGNRDQFVFAANSNHDVIVNFTSNQDKIDLSAFVTANDPDGWFNQHVAVSPTNSHDMLVTIDPADTIVLRNVAHLTANDFILHTA